MNLCATIAGGLAALTLAACASPEPVVPTPPSVRVGGFDTQVITPEVIKFQAKVVIDNRMAAGLELSEVVWGADLFETNVFSETFKELQPLKSRGQLTVTFPFQIAMKDVLAQAVDVLADGSLRISFRGQVIPVGFEPVSFSATKVIPIPKFPSVTLHGAHGTPMERGFRVELQMRNPNGFPICLTKMDSYLDLNGKRYGLLRAQGDTDIAPGAAERVTLTMAQPAGKGLSMLVNIAQSGTAHFGVGGSVGWQTPHGLILIPLEISSEAASPR